MADPDRLNPPKLPVTAEVGGEGGSYADASVQAETFTGDNRRIDDLTDPAPPEVPAPADDEESPGEGTRKYPTE